jgi:hypothetical protein
MAKAHYLVPTGITSDPITVRLGASNAEADRLTTADKGKLVKHTGDSQYELCVAGDMIEGAILNVEVAPSAGWTVGGVVQRDTMFVVADGSEAAGTGNLAVGDFVVAGAITAKGTPLEMYPKVRKATLQLGSVPADLTAAGKMALYAAKGAWKVVSLYKQGTGAPGTIVVIQRA